MRRRNEMKMRLDIGLQTHSKRNEHKWKREKRRTLLNITLVSVDTEKLIVLHCVLCSEQLRKIGQVWGTTLDIVCVFERRRRRRQMNEKS